MINIRLLVALVLVGMTAVVTAAVREPSSAPIAAPAVPYGLDSWHGVDSPLVDAETEGLNADLIVNRTYTDTQGSEAGLYVAFYSQQRPGVSIHSPLHCLPGTGWEVVSNDTIAVDLNRGANHMRRLVAQKASARILVLYWYSINGQMVTNEFASRLQLLSNRLRLGRNDAALVRIAVPVTATDAAAEAEAVTFARALVPHLL
jgi:EpsI family protein